MPDATVDADPTFPCPRCGAEVTQRFFGPCGSCRHDLRSRMSREPQEIHAARFEPALHVVANHVATRD